MSAVFPPQRVLGLRNRGRSISTGLTRRRRDAELRGVESIVDQGLRTGAFDDGTLHVLDDYLDARQALYLEHIEIRETHLRRKASVRVARAVKRAERRHARLRELEVRLERAEARFVPIDAELRNGQPETPIRARFTRVDGPVHLDGHALRAPVTAVDPDLPSATTTPIRPRSPKEPNQ